MFGNFKIADLVAYHFMKIDYRCREDLQRGRIVSERDYVRKKRFFHSLTFPRYTQFGTKLSPLFGFAKSSKYKTNFKSSLLPKLLVACVELTFGSAKPKK